MSHNKGETAVHGYQCLGDMAVRMREVLAWPWVSLCTPLVLSLPPYNVSLTWGHMRISGCRFVSVKKSKKSLETKRQQEIRLRSHVMQAQAASFPLEKRDRQKAPHAPKSFEAGSRHFQTELLDG